MKRRSICIFIIFAMLLGVLSTMTSCKDSNDGDTIELKNLTGAVGAPLPEASDFVVTLPEGASLRFSENYSFSQLGSYRLTLIMTDRRGKQSEHEVEMTLINDQEKPTIVGVNDISVYVGDGVSYRNGISLLDNCDGPVRLEVDSKAVDTSKEGVYAVTYTAIDAAGNVTVKEISVYVYTLRVTEEMLWGEIDRLIEEKIPKQFTTEQKARAIYSYVYYAISYSDSSDKSDWIRAAYDGIRTGQGDCFTYFALSKAFFIRLGIESKDVKRTEGIVDERHYWSMVNIGTEASPRWYHFDACHIRNVAAPFGCLLTDAQIDAFNQYRVDANGVSGYFYAYDRASYPATDATIITVTQFD